MEEAAPGRLVIVGGALDSANAEVYRAVIEGRDGNGPLCVLPTASGEPAASMESAAAILAAYAGPGAVVGILLSTDDPARADSSSVADSLAACSGYFFTGGAQSRVLDVFLPQGDTTEAFRALWRRWQEGAVVSGSSAGAAMMSGIMIASGNSPEAVERGLAAQEDGEGISIRRGMGFFERAMLDQHFLARGRIGRLLVAVLAVDSVPVGLGIDENTALVVDGATARVVGASGVVVVDGRAAERTSAIRGSGIRVTLAGTGDLVDLGTFEVRRAPAKVALPPSDAALTAPDDPFERWAFLHVLLGLAAGPEQTVTFEIGDAVLTLREGEGFSAAMTGQEGGVEGVPLGFSAGPYVVDLLPAR